jgi:dTDP-4-amino-4,6-dideoxygalactose transaminase
MRQLAVLGGSPKFAEPLHVGRPNIPDRRVFARLVEDILDTRYLTNEGPCVAEFEARLAARLGVRHCIATCNSTTALMITLRAVGVQGEVVMPSFTFPATAHAARWLGLDPVFVDVDPGTHTLDPRRAAEVVTSRTEAILGVHVWGRACDIEALEELAKRRGLALVFDAAPAFDCTYRGRKLGNFGAAETMSFHATKVLNTFEGGAILTNDDELAERVRPMTQFGFEEEDFVLGLGINGKMSEVCAAMGLASLELVDGFIAANRANHKRYAEGLAGLPGLHLMSYPEEEAANYHYVVLEVDPREAPIKRDLLKRTLVAENVLARRYFYPGCHRIEPYCKERARGIGTLRETEGLVERVLQLPTGTAVTEGDIDGVCEIVRNAFERTEELAELDAPFFRTG